MPTLPEGRRKKRKIFFISHFIAFNPSPKTLSQVSIIPSRLMTELRHQEAIVDHLSQGQDINSEQSLGDFISNLRRVPLVCLP